MRWRPAHEDHAIERVALSLFFTEPVGQKAWDSLLLAATSEATNHGFASIADAVQLTLQNPAQYGGGNVLSVSNSVPTGRSFVLNRSPGVFDELQLHRTNFIFSTTKYSRWDDFKLRVLQSLSSSLDRALTVINVQHIKLEYWDQFNFDGLIEDIEYQSLLKTDCEFIPKFVFQMPSLWHSHVGYFSNVKAAPACLINLNVDALDIPNPDPVTTSVSTATSIRTVGFYSMAQFTFSDRTYIESSTGLTLPIDEAHSILKELLGRVITESAANRISLTKGANG